jgi:Acetyltransferase (GNAT) domain
MTSSAVSVRPARPEDLGGMLALWRTVFGEGFSGGSLAEGTLRWLIEANPSARAEPWGWIAELEGEIVGAELATPVLLSVDDEAYPAHWLMATAVSRKGQGRGISRILYRAIKGRPGLTLGVGVTPEVLRLYQLEKVRFVGADPFALRIMSTPVLLRRVLGHVRRREIPRAKAAARALLRRAVRPRATIPISRRETLPDDVGALTGRMRQAIPVMISRASDEMAWRGANPRLKAIVFEARAGGGDLRGLAVVRADGVILDLLAVPTDRAAMDSLLDAVIRWARERKLPELSAIKPPMEDFRSAYEDAGFLSLDFGFHLFFAPTPDPVLNEKLADPSRWYFSMGDSDLWSLRLGS